MKKYMVETGWRVRVGPDGRGDAEEWPNGDERWYDAEGEARRAFDGRDIEAQWEARAFAGRAEEALQRDAYAVLEVWRETEDGLEFVERLDERAYGYSDLSSGENPENLPMRKGETMAKAYGIARVCPECGASFTGHRNRRVCVDCSFRRAAQLARVGAARKRIVEQQVEHERRIWP